MPPLTAQGMRMPGLGLGTWRLAGAACQDAVERAIAVGYRRTDPAQMHGNEDAVGAAIPKAARLVNPGWAPAWDRAP